jgi:hypothetical protein
VKLGEYNFFLVAIQVYQRFLQIFGQSIFRGNTPDFASTVIRTSSNNLVVKWVEVAIKDGTCVSGDLRNGIVEFSDILQTVVSVLWQ